MPGTAYTGTTDPLLKTTTTIIDTTTSDYIDYKITDSSGTVTSGVLSTSAKLTVEDIENALRQVNRFKPIPEKKKENLRHWLYGKDEGEI